MTDSPRIVRVVKGIGDIAPAVWDALANPDSASYDPFVTHAFILALEKSGSIARRTGWLPQHLLMEEADGTAVAALPLYLKGHSLGEFVFDHGWAEAHERAGLSYYPKVLAAIPVTPVPGRRFLTGKAADPIPLQRALTSAAIELTRQNGYSSFHATFLNEAQAEQTVADGLLQRQGHQYHWTNQGFSSFDDFLATLASRKRKTLKRERRDAVANGISVERLTGADITQAHWDAFFAFYMDTGGRKWGSPYLNRKFFSLLGESLAKDCLLVMAKRDGRYIAGALNLIGGEAVYGRYWGCTEQHPFLHFELCYYQAIDFAIERKLKRVEAGAGGEHKLVRGYEPVITRSAHWIAEPRLHAAIAQFLERERERVAREGEILTEMAPFKQGLLPKKTRTDI